MRFLIVLYLSAQGVWASYGTSYGSSSSNSSMTLKSENIDIRIADFIHYAKDMPDNEIKRDWYKRDENDNLLSPSASYKDNILRILLKQLIKQFSNEKNNRTEIIIKLLKFLNSFIRERFIPSDHQEALKEVFSHIRGLQHKPPMQVTSIIFDALSDDAKKAFRDEGVRVQTNGLEQAPTGQNVSTTHANPILVEVLFMQLVWDAEKCAVTRQDLFSSIDKNMVKMERLFRDNAIVGTFESLRSTLVGRAQKESPLPDLVKYIISLIRGSKNDLDHKYKKLLTSKDRRKWKEITKTKAKPAVSIWIKKEEPKKPTAEETRNYEEKKKKSEIKDRFNKVKDEEITKTTNKVTGAAAGAFDDIIGKFSQSLSGIFG